MPIFNLKITQTVVAERVHEVEGDTLEEAIHFLEGAIVTIGSLAMPLGPMAVNITEDEYDITEVKE